MINYILYYFGRKSKPWKRFKCMPGKGEEWTEEELDQTAEAVGYGAVK